MLRSWSQATWPADDFTRDENLRDLERHEREHRGEWRSRTPCSTRRRPAASDASTSRRSRPRSPRYARAVRTGVRVGFWVRTSEVANELDRHLLAVLRDWFASDWAFDTTLFGVSPQETRQASVLAETGLTFRGRSRSRTVGRSGSSSRDEGIDPISAYWTPPRVRRLVAIDTSAPRSPHDRDIRGLKNVPSTLNLLPFA